MPTPLYHVRRLDNDGVWRQFGQEGTYQEAFELFQRLTQAQGVRRVQLVAALHPSQNAGMQTGTCVHRYGAPDQCTERPTIDAPSPDGRWGYWCELHWRETLRERPSRYLHATNMGEAPVYFVVLAKEGTAS